MTSPKDPRADKQQVWIQYGPVITKRMVDEITEKATWWQKMRLRLRPSEYSVDGNSVIRYKEMDNKIYIISRGTRL